MCRMPALAATVLALAALPAMAGTPKPKAPPAVAPATPAKANAMQRAEVRRLDPLARAAFWAREAEVDGRDVEAAVGLSQALRILGRYPEAAAAAERALVVDPSNIDALLEAARAQIGRGQGFYAIDPARRAQALAPQDWRPVSLLGVAYEQASRDDEALAAHRQAVTLAPGESGPLTNLAMFHAGHGDLAQAEALLRRAVALPTATSQVRQNLALVIGLQGRIDEAERLVRQDLPPEAVKNNLAWLRAATAKPAARTWETMKDGGGGL